MDKEKIAAFMKLNAFCFVDLFSYFIAKYKQTYKHYPEEVYVCTAQTLDKLPIDVIFAIKVIFEVDNTLYDLEAEKFENSVNSPVDKIVRYKNTYCSLRTESESFDEVLTRLLNSVTQEMLYEIDDEPLFSTGLKLSNKDNDVKPFMLIIEKKKDVFLPNDMITSKELLDYFNIVEYEYDLMKKEG